MQIIQEKPTKVKWTRLLKSLVAGQQGIVTELENRKRISVAIARLNKKGFDFESHKENGVLKVYRNPDKTT